MSTTMCRQIQQNKQSLSALKAPAIKRSVERAIAEKPKNRVIHQTWYNTLLCMGMPGCM